METGAIGAAIGVLNGVAWIAAATVGTLVAWRRPNISLGWIVCAMSLLMGLRFFVDGFVIEMPGITTEVPPGHQFAAWLASWVLGPSMSLIALLFLLFPDGRVPNRYWRPAIWIIAAFGCLFTLGLALRPGPLLGTGEIVNPVGLEGFDSALQITRLVGRVGLTLSLIASATSLICASDVLAGTSVNK